MQQFHRTTLFPDNGNFRTVVYSHGWSDLEPFKIIDNPLALRYTVSVSPSTIVLIHTTPRPNGLSITGECKRMLTSEEKRSVKEQVRSIFRLNESLDDFYDLCNNEKPLRWIPKIGGGRLLRSATVFEDIVKMICTTNCSWSLTKTIVGHLTRKLGTKFGDTMYLFPTPEAIASQTERWMRKETSCGYRAPYLLAFAKRVAAGSLNVEQLRTVPMSTAELYAVLRTIKGVGHYAAGNLLKLLGHYDYLSIDSWIRSRYSVLHNNGRKISDAAIEKHYARYGKWRGLICWMEMTKDWHLQR